MFFSFSWLCSVTSSSSWAYIHRPVGSIFWVVRPLAKAVWVAAICPRKAQKIFYFSVVWIGSRSTFVLCTALPRPYLAMGQGGQLPPRLGNWLQSIIKYSLFVAASYWAIMDLPAPLSCFSRGFARPTSILANSVICACANLCGAKKPGPAMAGPAGVGATALIQYINTCPAIWHPIGTCTCTPTAVDNSC